MKISDSWALALPPEDTKKIVESFAKAFETLSNKRNEFRFGLDEPRLTKKLALHLQNTKYVDHPVGIWDFEVNQNKLDESDPRRLDIRFFTVRDNVYKVTLVFECKKLLSNPPASVTRSVNAYIQGGIQRFVSGSYASEEPLGFMAAFIESTGWNAVDSLKSALGIEKNRNSVCMIQNEFGQYLTMPSSRFSPMSDFSTVHERNQGDFKLRPDTIEIYHIMLSFTVRP